MTDPFASRALSLSGPATDIVSVQPSDTVDLPHVAIALYVEGAGTLSFVTAAGAARVVQVADFSILPVGARRVNLTGTTAQGLHALVLV